MHVRKKVTHKFLPCKETTNNIILFAQLLLNDLECSKNQKIVVHCVKHGIDLRAVEDIVRFRD